MAVVSATQNGSFLTTKNGNFYLSTDKELVNPFRAVNGKVSFMKFKTENFNGADQEKMYIGISDDEGTYQLGIKVDSAHFGKILGFLKNADLSRTIEISVKGDPNPKDPTKTLHTFFVSQDGVTMKNAYPKGTLPAWKELMISGKKVYDKTDYWNELKRIVEQEMIPQFSENSVPQANNQDESDKSLPF